jgi:hypothetical protein
MIIVLVFTVIALLIFSVWNLLTLKNLTKDKANYGNQLQDPKYFELKYKIEFLIAIFSVIVALAGLLGYNTLQNAKSEIKADINKELQPIDIRIKNTEISINKNDSIVNSLGSKTETISDSLIKYDFKVKRQNTNLTYLENKIAIINGKNIIKQNYYIVSSIKYKYDENDNSDKQFYFSNLRTSSGDKLPYFELPPLIIPIPESNVMADIIDITNESFKVGCLGYYSKVDSVKVSILIFKK